MFSTSQLLSFLAVDLVFLAAICATVLIIARLMRTGGSLSVAVLASIVVLTSAYAIWIARGRTILLPVPLLILAWCVRRSKSKKTDGALNVDAIAPGLAGVVVYFAYYFQAFSRGAGGLINYPAGDYLYYSRLVRYVNILGIENPRLDYLYPGRFSVEVYHWGDIWFGALMNGMLGMDFRACLLLGAYPVLAGVCCMLVFESLRRLFPGIRRWQAMFLALLALVLGGLALLYPAFLYRPYIFSGTVGYYPKLLWVMAMSLWLLHELRSGAYTRALIIVAVACITFITIAPALGLATIAFFAHKLITGTIRWATILPGILALTGAGVFFVSFYALQSRTSGNTGLVNLAAPDWLAYLKTGAVCIGKGALQLLRMLPLCVALALAGLLLRRRFQAHLISDDVRFLFLWLGSGLIAWSLTEPFSWDAMQSFQSVFMIVAAIFTVRLGGFLLSQKKLPLAVLTLALLALNLACHHRFDYQVQAVHQKTLDSVTSFLQPHSNGRLASLAAPSRFSSKYGLNTALLYPLDYLDYRFAPYVNVSLDIPFVHLPAANPGEARQSQALIDWAPFSYYLQQNLSSSKDTGALALDFIRKNDIRDIIVEDGRTLPSAIRPLDSFRLSSGGITIYRVH